MYSVLNGSLKSFSMYRSCSCSPAFLADDDMAGYRCRSASILTSQLAFSQSGMNSSNASFRFFFHTRSRRNPHHWSKNTASSNMAVTALKAMTATPMIFHSCVLREMDCPPEGFVGDGLAATLDVRERFALVGVGVIGSWDVGATDEEIPAGIV